MITYVVFKAYSETILYVGDDLKKASKSALENMDTSTTIIVQEWQDGKQMEEW